MSFRRRLTTSSPWGGVLRVTASLGVGVTTEGDKDTLIATTDPALYEAKRAGRNRTVRASPLATNRGSGE
jgi:PleD family two-component response regulator